MEIKKQIVKYLQNKKTKKITKKLKAYNHIKSAKKKTAKITVLCLYKRKFLVKIIILIIKYER